MLLNNITSKAIADQVGVKHQQSVDGVINGRRPTIKIREAIAKAINKPVDEIWPQQEQ